MFSITFNKYQPQDKLIDDKLTRTEWKQLNF